MSVRLLMLALEISFLACLALFTTGVAADSDSLRASSDTNPPRVALPEAKVIAESAIPPPTAQFRMDSSRVFSFVTSEDTLPAGGPGGPRDARLVAGLGAFPITQRITCLGPGLSGDTATVVLANYAKVKDPRIVSRGGPTPLYLLITATARIDSADGRIHQEIRLPLGDSLPTDTSGSRQWDFPRTLWDFYGHWMLYLSDTFRYERTLANPLAGITTTTLQTVGRDTIQHHPCWVVRYRTGAPDRPGLVKTYWVDMADRVAVQVRQEHLVMKQVMGEPSSPNEKK